VVPGDLVQLERNEIMLSLRKIPKLTRSDIIRFWGKVNKKDKKDCWFWKASLQPNGYGQFNIQSQIFLAHRIAYF